MIEDVIIDIFYEYSFMGYSNKNVKYLSNINNWTKHKPHFKLGFVQVFLFELFGSNLDHIIGLIWKFINTDRFQI